MKIYFAGSVRGGRAMQPWYGCIVKELEAYGTLISTHVASDELLRAGETDVRNSDIWSRERERVHMADIVVADATTASLGGRNEREAKSHNNNRKQNPFHGIQSFQTSVVTKLLSCKYY